MTSTYDKLMDLEGYEPKSWYDLIVRIIAKIIVGISFLIVRYIIITIVVVKTLQYLGVL